jgi:hypothetical protein
MTLNIPKIRRWESFLLEKECPSFSSTYLQRAFSIEFGIFFKQV